MAGSDEEEEDANGDNGPPRHEGPPDERVLSPEELDFTEDEKVEQLDEGKFVIGTEGEPNVATAQEESPHRPPSSQGQPDTGTGEPGRTDSSTQPDPTETQGTSRRETQPGAAVNELTGRQVKDFLSAELRRTESTYAYRIAAKTEDRVSHQQLASDDIGMAFDGLLMWYAQQVGAETSVEEALGILLAKSNIRIRYPTKLLTAYLKKHDLGPDDDIADLMAAIKHEDGLVFPPDTG